MEAGTFQPEEVELTRRASLGVRYRAFRLSRKHLRNALPRMPIPLGRYRPFLLFPRQHEGEFRAQFLRIASHQNIGPE